MGKRARRNVHWIEPERDEPQPASINGVDETERMNDDAEPIPTLDEEATTQEDEEEIEPPGCPYLTPIVTFVVGSPPQQFQVHSGVLSQSAVLESRYRAAGLWNQPVELTDVDPSIFELALCHLYGRDYSDYFSPGNPRPNKANTEAAAFKRHSLLYCFARKYRLNVLTMLTTKNIMDLGQVAYQSVLAAAREAYKQFPDDESWFRDYFMEATKKASTEYDDLPRKPWILDTFRKERGDFTVDLFTALTEGYGKRLSRASNTDSESETARESSSRQSSTKRTEREPVSSPHITTDEIVGGEAVFIQEDSCAEDLTPVESPCIVEAIPEPTSVDDVAEGAPGGFDWDIWGAWRSSGKKKRTPAEEAPAEEVPAEEALAEYAPTEEAPAEEAPAEEAPAEETPVDEAPAEESPAEETPAEETPAEEAPADYYVFTRASKYKTFAQETKPDNTCRRRGYHLADDSRWMECQKCRAELSAIAREMTASTPGWRIFS